MNERLKQHGFTAGIILLSCTAAFGIGRLSGPGPGYEPVTIDYFQEPPPANLAATPALAVEGALVEQAAPGQVVASKKGAKYHFPWCSGASTISAENKITFASADEARAAGYEPAANCKGLK